MRSLAQASPLVAACMARGRRGVALAVLASSVATGCDESPADTELPLIQTDHASYTLTAFAWGLATEIDYRFENRTAGPVFIENCYGSFGIALDRWAGGRWVGVWSAVTASCRSEPIRIDPGEVFADTLDLSGGWPGSNRVPRFDSAEMDGTYRLRWGVGNVQVRDRIGLRPLAEEYRVSNAFDLDAPVGSCPAC